MRGVKPACPAERYVPKALKETFWSFFSGQARSDEAADKAHEASLARALEFVKKASDAGVPILCGSDTPNPYVVPGASLQEEVVELAKALGPAKALECATLANARALGRDDVGRIAAGARADLLLLAKDPRLDASAVSAIEAVIVRGHLHDKKSIDARLSAIEEKAKEEDVVPATGFESIAGTLSDRKPVTPEYRLEGRLGSSPASFWVRLRSFEGPREGETMIFLRSSGSLPVPVRQSEDLLLSKDGAVLRFHMSKESLGERRETTVERRDAGWRIQLFAKGEKKLDATAPHDEEPSVEGQLLLLRLAGSLSLEEGEKTTRKLRFIDLDRMKVHDAVEWTIARRKNPVSDAKDPRSRGRYFVTRSAAGEIGLWVSGTEPLGVELALPFGKFLLARVAKKFY